jgi:transcriptional regulator with XRE-family HTH domain
MASRSAAALGEIIRQQRELAELSMRQFAQLAGISNPYLSQIERGLRAPSEQVLDGIANALKVSADTLYERAGVSPPDTKLTARQRGAMLEVYEAFTGDGGPRKRSATSKSR